MKKISIVASCYNEELNIEEFYERCLKQIDAFRDRYEFEFIIADNASTDNTVQKLTEIAEKDKSFKVILNSRNFGQLRSPFYAIQHAYGDAVIVLCSDLQDPPELIPELIKKWENGNDAVMLQKQSSEENPLIFVLRKLYYAMLSKMSDNGVELVQNSTGSGLYDKKIVDFIRTVDDTIPFFRGLVCEAGFKRDYVEFSQPVRKRGKSKNNLYTLYDLGMNGIVKYTRIPLRIMAITGFIMSLLSLLGAFVYFVWKLLNWNSFSIGIAPIIICILFLGSVQLFCLGILGEYIGIIYSRVDRKPIVIEKGRINF